MDSGNISQHPHARRATLDIQRVIQRLTSRRDHSSTSFLKWLWSKLDTENVGKVFDMIGAAEPLSLRVGWPVPTGRRTDRNLPVRAENIRLGPKS
jgi:hypothetical protein